MLQFREQVTGGDLNIDGTLLPWTENWVGPKWLKRFDTSIGRLGAGVDARALAAARRFRALVDDLRPMR